MGSTSGWLKNGNGTNSSGFSGLPGGSRTNNGDFNDVGSDGDWWSSSESVAYSAESVASGAWNRNLYYRNDDAYQLSNNKRHGFSVRCLRD